jgi:hypothetical protein
MSFIRVCAILAAAVVYLSVGGSTSASACCSKGDRYLQHPFCCDGALLNGTKSAIRTPEAASDLIFPAGLDECMIARSAGEVSNLSLIQTGWVRCAPQSLGLDGACSSWYSTLEYFVETRGGGGQYFCHPRGVVPYNTNVYYSVKREAGDSWFAYIGGVQQPMDVGMGDATFLTEGAEWTSNPQDCDPFSMYADFAIGVPWQRWTGSSWFTVQSSSRSLGCSWWDWGAPPNEFGFFH